MQERADQCAMDVKTKLNLSVTKSWSDLPQDIQILILERLYYEDQLRFRAVCKSWLVPKHLIKCLNSLPWTVSLDNYPSELELFDPHSRKSYKVTNPADKFKGYINPGERPTVFASKHGWLLLGQRRSSLFLHNPFTNDTLFPPAILHSRIIEATFTVDPKSPGCEILVFSMLFIDSGKRTHLFMNRYHISNDTQTLSSQSLGKNRDGILSNVDESWSTQILGTYGPYSLGVRSTYYLNEKLYCILHLLTPSASFMCYDLSDKSWTQLGNTMPPVAESVGLVGWNRRWLTSKGENLIMICSGNTDFKVFKFDWSKMCWVEAYFKETTFFIKDSMIFLSMFDRDRCRVLYANSYGSSGCFSLKQKEEVEEEEYSWIMRQWRNMSLAEPHISEMNS